MFSKDKYILMKDENTYKALGRSEDGRILYGVGAFTNVNGGIYLGELDKYHNYQIGAMLDPSFKRLANFDPDSNSGLEIILFYKKLFLRRVVNGKAEGLEYILEKGKNIVVNRYKADKKLDSKELNFLVDISLTCKLPKVHISAPLELCETKLADVYLNDDDKFALAANIGKDFETVGLLNNYAFKDLYFYKTTINEVIYDLKIKNLIFTYKLDREEVEFKNINNNVIFNLNNHDELTIKTLSEDGKTIETTVYTLNDFLKA